MKNIFITCMALMMASMLNAQDWEFAGNNSVNPALGDMLGTTDNTPIPLVTNGNLRMLIKEGTGGQSGQIGFGNNLATNFMPQQRLHLHQGNDNNDNFIRWSIGGV